MDHPGPSAPKRAREGSNLRPPGSLPPVLCQLSYSRKSAGKDSNLRPPPAPSEQQVALPLSYPRERKKPLALPPKRMRRGADHHACRSGARESSRDQWELRFMSDMMGTASLRVKSPVPASTVSLRMAEEDVLPAADELANALAVRAVAGLAPPRRILPGLAVMMMSSSGHDVSSAPAGC